MTQITSKITSDNNRDNKFSGLFGEDTFNNMPIYIYAEKLFYAGMKQMVKGYKGGYFDFIEIVEADVEIEKSGFFPIIEENYNKEVEMISHTGLSQTLSLQSASLVVWLILIEQIAHSDDVAQVVKQRLFNTMQDIQYCYSRLTDEKGNKMFSADDCTAIYRFLD